MSTRPIPEAFYACAFGCCFKSQTFPPDMLFWSRQEHGWICEDCAGEYELEIAETTLKDHLAGLAKIRSRAARDSRLLA